MAAAIALRARRGITFPEFSNIPSGKEGTAQIESVESTKNHEKERDLGERFKRFRGETYGRFSVTHFNFSLERSWPSDL